jgi:phosphate transport system substrate-binding protein
VKRTSPRQFAASAAAFSLTLALGACSAANESNASSGGSGGGSSLSGSISGAGASSQEAAMQAWGVGFQQQNPGVTVNYDPSGSGAGVEQFIAGAVPFAGSDAYLTADEMAKAQKRCAPGDVNEIPVYVSPIAVIYNLEGVDNLQLSPETLAGIFAGDITTWNDPAIAKDNPGVKLPSMRITPVHRSDESGTSANFTDYMSQTAPKDWTAGSVETWPGKLGGEAASGTSGVVAAVKAGAGTIGYADASQAGSLGTAAIKVGQDYVSYSPEAAAKVVDISPQAQDQPSTSMAVDVERTTTEQGVYPLVLVSYHLSCTQYDDAKEAKLVKAFEQYVVSDAGQQISAKNAGSAPISSSVSQQAEQIIGKIETSG